MQDSIPDGFPGVQHRLLALLSFLRPVARRTGNQAEVTSSDETDMTRVLIVVAATPLAVCKERALLLLHNVLRIPKVKIFMLLYFFCTSIFTKDHSYTSRFVSVSVSRIILIVTITEVLPISIIRA